jgi:hypothetical protein
VQQREAEALSQSVFEGENGVLLHIGQQVRVDIQGDADRGSLYLLYLLKLAREMGLESFHGSCGEPDSAAAVLGFRFTKNKGFIRAGEGAKHAALKVHIIPLESQELALAHSGIGCQDVEGFEPVASDLLQEAPGLLLLVAG